MWIFPLVGSTFLVNQKCSYFKLYENTLVTHITAISLQDYRQKCIFTVNESLRAENMSINCVCPPSVSPGAVEIEKNTQRNPAVTPCEV